MDLRAGQEVVEGEHRRPATHPGEPPEWDVGRADFPLVPVARDRWVALRRVMRTDLGLEG
ncbi:hypothetical protein [Kitasatospora sp. NPDC051705]|uniref:hypothetical protein n=1 Tax=Kitasatospora sp. NPDC051705 TaxID=3364057 RepID=UPI0037B802F2